jgi:hypothetical protein
MSTLSGGPNIVTDGLVLYLDAANVKSLADVPATNLLTWSEQFEDASWVKTRSTVISNITNSPINTLTGDKLIDNTENNNHQFGKLTTAPINSPIIGSIYVKKSDYNNIVLRITDNAANINGTISSYQANFNIVNGTITFQSSFDGNALNPIATITQDKDGWFRCSIGLTKRADATRTDFQVFLFNRDGFFDNPTFIGTGDKGNFVWGAQLETGTTPTTYIPTTTTAVSRVPNWNDISRGGNNGTLVNGPTYNPANGGSLVFDGVNDYVNLGTSIDNNLTWTICSWFYITSFISTDHRALIGNSGTSPAGSGKFMGISSDSINSSRFRKPWIITYNSLGTQIQIYGNTSILSNTWYYMVSTFTGAQVSVYLNGVLDATPINVSGYLPSNNLTTIGMLRAVFWPFPGNIPQTQIYNRALSPSEVLQNFNATRARFGI